MPPKDEQFLNDFYDMKMDVMLIKNKLEECSRAKGRCAEHHDFITTRNAIDQNNKYIIWKTSAYTGGITAVLAIILRLAHII